MAKKTKKDQESEEKEILKFLCDMKNQLETAGKKLEEIIETLRNRNHSIRLLKDLSIVINAKDINDPFLEKAIARLNAGHK